MNYSYWLLLLLITLIDSKYYYCFVIITTIIGMLTSFVGSSWDDVLWLIRCYEASKWVLGLLAVPQCYKWWCSSGSCLNGFELIVYVLSNSFLDGCWMFSSKAGWKSQLFEASKLSKLGIPQLRKTNKHLTPGVGATTKRTTASLPVDPPKSHPLKDPSITL